MAEVVDEKHLLSARDLLRTTLKNSRALTLSLADTSHRLDNFRRLTLLSLEAQYLPNNDHLCILKQHFNWAVRPIDAVVKAFHSVHHLETSLSTSPPAALHPISTTYVSAVKSLEEALGFLTNSCTLAIQWLNGTVEFLQRDVHVADREWYLDKVNRCLCTIRKLQGAEQRSRLRGGTLDVALSNLEDEFKRLLESQGRRCTPPVAQKLQPIIKRLRSNDRLDKCVSVFIDVRTRSASETLKSVGNLETDSGLEEAEGGFIGKWKRHLVFALTEVLEKEYLVCREVFEGGDTWRRCFEGIAVGSGFSKILRVGIMRVAEEGKKGPNKLLNMLDMFSSMDEVRPNFGRLFGGEYGCKEIQDATRDLVKKVVQGCWDIFWELSYQVELQRETAPPSDGGVPKLVSFVTDYCNHLLSDAYRAPMIQVLMIYQSWKREKYQEGLFTNQIFNVMKQIGLNLDSWSKAYDDRALSYLFMMNNHSHLCSLSGTKLGVLMGESWVKSHQQYRDNCAALYVKESWDNIVVSLSEKDNFSDENYLRRFNEVFQSMYQKHLQWSIPDEKMRAKVLKTIAQSVVPAYRSCFIKQHSWQVRVRSSHGNLITIITVQAMEDMIGSLFQAPPRKGIIGNDYLMKTTTDKIVNVVVADSSRYSFTLTAA